MIGSQPQRQAPSGPSAEQLGIQQMANFAQPQNSLAGILSNLNAITAPTMSPYGGGGTSVVVMPQAQNTTAAARGTVPSISLGGSGASSSPTSSLSASQISSLGKTLSGLLGGKSLASDMGLTAGSLGAPLTASQLSPVGTGAVTSAANQAGASAQSELNGALGTPSLASAMGLNGASLGAPLTASQLAPVATSAIGSVGSQAGSQAAAELANALGSSGTAGSLASAMGLTAGSLAPLTASQLAPVSTAAVSQAANQAGQSAAQELANSGAGSSATSGLAGDASTALGALGTGYSLYNEINNYKSGATGSDALGGAETGAGIGTMILPGIGTAIGGLLGGAAGALSSAFGGGRPDPETTAWNSIAKSASANPSILSSESPANLYQNLAGIMDAKNNSPGHSTALEQVFGRMGEQNLMDQMTGQVNQAIAANPSLSGDSASQLYSSVVEPWLQSKNAYVAPSAIVSSNGATAGNSINTMLTSLLGDWMSGGITPSSKLGIAGQTIAGLPTFSGSAASAAASPATALLSRAAPALRAGAMMMR
jgi:hypothetical protein